MKLLAHSLWTAILAVSVTTAVVADDSPLRDQTIETIPTAPEPANTPAVDLPVPWWRESIRVPLGIAVQTATITADEAVIRSLGQSPDIQVFNVQPLIERTEITRQQAAFDWNNFLESNWIDSSDPIGSRLTTGSLSGRYLNHLYGGAAGARKTTTSGASVELAQRMGWQQNNSLFLIPNAQNTSRLALTLTQPLMAGRGESYNMRRVFEARLLAEGSESQAIAQVQEYLVSVYERYWELYQARAIFIQRKRAADRADRLAESLLRRAQFDTTSRQLVRSRTAASQQRAQLMLAASAADMAAIELRRLVGIVDVESELIPMQSPTISAEPIDRSIALQTALSKRAEIDVAVRDIRIAGVHLGASKNELMPQLDLIAGAYVAGLTPGAAFANSFGNQFASGRPSYNVGLAWERPAGYRAARSANYRRQLEMQEAMGRYETAVQNVRRDVEVELHQVHLTYRSLLQRHESLAASQAEAAFLLDRWNTAPASDGPAILLLEDLINAQSRLADEENETVIAETNHALAQVRYLRAIGTILQSTPMTVVCNEQVGELPMPTETMIESDADVPFSARAIDELPSPQGSQP